MAYLSITFLIASISARLNATNIYAKAIATAPMTSAAFTLAIHTPQPPYFAVVTAQPAAS